jgi:hypothetical protein
MLNHFMENPKIPNEIKLLDEKTKVKEITQKMSKN